MRTENEIRTRLAMWKDMQKHTSNKVCIDEIQFHINELLWILGK